MYNPTKPYKYKILKLIESTWDTPYVKVNRGLCPIIKKKFSFSEVQHTDGIGTKGFYHWRKRSFRNAVTDSLAMNLNDLAMMGSTPYAIQNHITLPKDDHEAILMLVKWLTVGCRKQKIAMTGGETSIHSDADGIDISITVSGFVRHKLTNVCKAGDVLIGIKSKGLHANGFTKVRQIFGRKFRKDFTEPTAIYLPDILHLLGECDINGMMHITGGAFTKLKDILNQNDAYIFHPEKLKPHKIFEEIYTKDPSNKMMYSIFNCGIGFVISVPKNQSLKALSCLNKADIIGQVTSGNGKIHIRSAFDRRMITL